MASFRKTATSPSISATWFASAIRVGFVSKSSHLAPLAFQNRRVPREPVGRQTQHHRSISRDQRNPDFVN
jgi:hypothetical protein